MKQVWKRLCGIGSVVVIFQVERLPWISAFNIMNFNISSKYVMVFINTCILWHKAEYVTMTLGERVGIESCQEVRISPPANSASNICFFSEIEHWSPLVLVVNMHLLSSWDRLCLIFHIVTFDQHKVKWKKEDWVIPIFQAILA